MGSHQFASAFRAAFGDSGAGLDCSPGKAARRCGDVLQSTALSFSSPPCTCSPRPQKPPLFSTPSSSPNWSLPPASHTTPNPACDPPFLSPLFLPPHLWLVVLFSSSGDLFYPLCLASLNFPCKLYILVWTTSFFCLPSPATGS